MLASPRSVLAFESKLSLVIWREIPSRHIKIQDLYGIGYLSSVPALHKIPILLNVVSENVRQTPLRRLQVGHPLLVGSNRKNNAFWPHPLNPWHGITLSRSAQFPFSIPEIVLINFYGITKLIGGTIKAQKKKRTVW